LFRDRIHLLFAHLTPEYETVVFLNHPQLLSILSYFRTVVIFKIFMAVAAFQEARFALSTVYFWNRKSLSLSFSSPGFTTVSTSCAAPRFGSYVGRLGEPSWSGDGGGVGDRPTSG
jgi:hypothetical protein